INRFERQGLRLVSIKMLRLNESEAMAFYAVHKDKPFFKELVDYMSSGPIVAMVLEGEGAIGRVREIMGATDPNEAKAGTIRGDLGINKTENTVHGSDSKESAALEISFFFSQYDLKKGER
ncbi:MAG: nucleoside-diphosphate kinase, partial [Deltaproteobacteria bacterium]|nr:nucleoside-diphosphate kinase [Deltaproteobacteria bacterium]